MNVLTIRTDKPEAELGLYRDRKQFAYDTWEAHRQLAETIHNHIRELLSSQAIDLAALDGIVVFKGPGSFTGLRIGISVANAFSESLRIPIVGSDGDGWIATGLSLIASGTNQQIVLPEYGALPNLSTPKK